MAQMLSAEKIGDRPQKSGRRYVRIRAVFEDNDGNQRTHVVGPRLVQADFDVEGSFPQVEAQGLALFARNELADLTKIDGVPDPLDAVLNTKWTTTKEAAKAALYWMMRERDPRIVLYLESLIIYIQQNYNATQLANLLDITTDQVLKLNRRVNAILNAPADATSVKDMLAAFDAEQERF